jgi:uncharacterized protein YndB with AHSA1/START domain
LSGPHRSSFVYVTVIRTTAEKLWAALTDPQLIRQYWFGGIVECGWKKGSSWRKARADGTLTDSGEILVYEVSIFPRLIASASVVTPPSGPGATNSRSRMIC